MIVVYSSNQLTAKILNIISWLGQWDWSEWGKFLVAMLDNDRLEQPSLHSDSLKLGWTWNTQLIHSNFLSETLQLQLSTNCSSLQPRSISGVDRDLIESDYILKAAALDIAVCSHLLHQQLSQDLSQPRLEQILHKPGHTQPDSATTWLSNKASLPWPPLLSYHSDNLVSQALMELFWHQLLHCRLPPALCLSYRQI